MVDEEELTAQEKGGRARADALAPQRRSEIAREAAAARWSDVVPRATHEGPMRIGGVVIQCAVLEDGRRLITQSGFMVALGRARQAKGRGYYDADVNMPAFLTAKNLKPFIPNDLGVTSSQIEFRTLRGARAFGYSAELLPQVCGVFLDALDGKALARGQLHIAEKAKVLIRGLAHTGIIALVDEATGYQEVRDRQALQAILDKYIAKEFAAWAKRFPDEFYQQIFRLNSWPWMGMKKNRPWAVARFTDNLVYKRLAPGVLRELRERNPRDERGHRRTKHHQWLTADVGNPRLAEHLYGIIGLMRTCADGEWRDFLRRVEMAYPKQDTHQLRLFTDQAPA